MPMCSFKNRQYAKNFKSAKVSETLAMHMLMGGQKWNSAIDSESVRSPGMDMMTSVMKDD